MSVRSLLAYANSMLYGHFKACLASVLCIVLGVVIAQAVYSELLSSCSGWRQRMYAIICTRIHAPQYKKA